MPGQSGGGQTATTSQNTTFNQNSSTSPWGPFSDFILGGKPGEDGKPGTPGLLPNLAAAFQNSAWSPAMSNATNDYFNDVTRRNAIFRGSGFENVGAAMNQGQYDPHITPVTAPEIKAQDVSPVAARAGQGSLDPSNALFKFLNAEDVNPFVEQQGDAIINKLTRNTFENVLPQLRSGSIMSGMYGGNKDAQATGLAMSRLNEDIAPVLAGLGLNAWESGQNRAYGTATDLNRQATDLATSNANRTLAADTTNAANTINTGIVNNDQEMRRGAQVVANRNNALTYTAGANALSNQNYQDLMRSIMAPNDYSWNNLGRFASIFQPMMNSYPQTQTSGNSTMQGTQIIPQQNSGGNPFMMGLGGLLSLGSLAGGLGWKPFG